MTTSNITRSQRTAARVAGVAFLLAIAVVVFANYGINFRLIIPDNAGDTARNIMAHETLFRFNVACNLIYVVTIVVLLASLYVILEPVNRHLAVVAACFRLVFALMWGMTALSSLGALRLLGSAAYLPVFRADQLQVLARLHLTSSYDAYYVGLPFWGLASALCGYLWFRSGFVPRTLAWFGMVSSGWCVLCAFAFIIYPAFGETVNAYWFDMPLVIFETTLGLWLLFKGLSQAGMAEPGQSGTRA
jgi:hypothetical protein